MNLFNVRAGNTFKALSTWCCYWQYTTIDIAADKRRLLSSSVPVTENFETPLLRNN